MNLYRPFLVLKFTVLSSVAALAGPADFARDIQPIFARHCYECHGPEKQKGKLRLDVRSSAMRSGEGVVIVPGNAAQSDLYRRVTLPKGHTDIMPNRGEPLSRTEADSIRDWINQGAVWPENAGLAKHWAYVKPARSKLPDTKNRSWGENEIDHFVLARLEKEKLQPSPEAERARLLRRVHLDLIGLPPSPQDVEEFLADKHSDAYEKAVDRLLASPRYGERWARPWLDLARYADSSGYQRDNLWEIWPYRDWVISALNRDLPFDQFTIEQLAGDLLPNATLEQKVATGFNRCAPINVEAGSDQEESRVNQVMDRVNTLGTVWLGSTIECAQCHNHKYDPFTQKEYYQLFAFFNNTPKESEYANAKTTSALEFAGPYLQLPDASREKQRAAIQEKLSAFDGEMDLLREKLLAGQVDWERMLAAQLDSLPQTHGLDIAEFDAESDSPQETLDDQSILIHNDENAAAPQRDTYAATVHSKLANITGFKVEALTDPSLPGSGPGRADEKRPNFVLTGFKVTARTDGKEQPVKFGKTHASFEQKNFTADKALDSDPKGGWGISPQFFKNHWAIFETASPVGSSNGTTFTFTLKQDYGGGRMIGRLRLSALTGNVGGNDFPSDIVTIVSTPPGQRTAAQKKRLEDFYLSRHPQLEALKAARGKLAAELRDIPSPKTLAMQELAQPRMSAIFVRGNFMTQGEPVQPGVPAVLHPLSYDRPNRLALARWLASTNNPLVARVTVNRWWAEFFGHGLVTTPEDFGIKGEPPTHPELLDWLACEFMERGWSMKHIHRLIVTSATYRQSASTSPQLLAADAENKLYARGPRFRMDAEMIRDNALATAGLLSAKLGGPPVHPYQPPGIWESKVGGVRVTYDVSEGEDRFRRGIYTVWKRTSPYPSFITFDAPARNACMVRRPRSNTPLQSLTLLNDPVYVEATKTLVKRVLVEKSSADVAEKIRFAFELCMARMPTARELEVLTRLYKDQLGASKKDSAASAKLLGDFSLPAGIDAAQFAAWYGVASALLNLDETIIKG